MAKGKKQLQALKTQSSTNEWKSTKGSIHLETGGMTSKKLGHFYSCKKRTFEKSVSQKFECCREKGISQKKFWENSNRKPVRDFKIRVWAQIELSTKISSEEGV